MRAEEEEIEELARYLNALGNPRRLELLARLRIPRSIGEIHLKPSRRDVDANPQRAISRNAVERHLQLLKAIGVVASRPGERDGRHVEEYLLHHARLFQVIEELRALTQLRPRDAFSVSVTEGDSPRVQATPAKGPHVTLLSGPGEGRAHELLHGGPWTVGRSSGSDVPLDYDPYVSSAHAVLERGKDGGFVVRDLPTNRNGTLLNWSPLPRGGASKLSSGDVLRVGRSLLLFRDAAPATAPGR